MADRTAVIAVFSRHSDADAAIRKLAQSGLDMTHFSVVGKGYHSEEKVVGFYNVGDRMRFWGKNGAFWGGLWGLFFGGILFTVPVLGEVMVLGHLAAMVFSAIEGALVVGGLSALGAALYSIGIPKDSVIEYENALKVDSFLVVGQGTPDEMARAREILASQNPVRLDVHPDIKDSTAAARCMPAPANERATNAMRVRGDAPTAPGEDRQQCE